MFTAHPRSKALQSSMIFPRSGDTPSKAANAQLTCARILMPHPLLIGRPELRMISRLMRIGIIGAGHAGVEAACAAREQGAEVVVFSAEDVLPYYRPRLVSYAFGHAEYEAIRMHPAEWYASRGIDLRVGTPVGNFDPVRKIIRAAGKEEQFDAVVLASGSEPIRPPFAAAAAPHVFPLWNITQANAIREAVIAAKGGRVVIVGGGILGIEAALNALDANLSPTIIELAERLMPIQLGERASTILLRRLKAKGVNVVLGGTVQSCERMADGKSLRMHMSKGLAIETDFAVLSIGARPETALAAGAGLRKERGLVVSPTLETSVPGCFAAGDIIQFAGLTRCSAREAASQGKLAGANAAAFAAGRLGKEHHPQSLPLMFRSGDFEVYAIGKPGGEACEEHLLSGTTEDVIRSLIAKDGIPVGVQMIGTRRELDRYAELIRRSEAGEDVRALYESLLKEAEV
jgi:nitrite reductase (NADH) large subunit